MDIKQIVQEMIARDKIEMNIYRCFLVGDLSGVVLRRMNDLIQAEPDMLDCVMSFLLYPAIKWMLSAEKVSEVAGKFCGESTTKMNKAQELLTQASGIKATLLLERRACYFASCREFCATIDRITEEIGKYPNEGVNYAKALRATLDESVSMSKHLYNKNISEAFRLVYATYNDDLSHLLDQILTGEVITNDEMQFVYHNVGLLLEEYEKVLWMAKISGDKSLRLLACETEEEMLRITQKDETYRQAYVVAEYIKFIRASVEVVKDFPGKDKDYYTILSQLLELKPEKKPDSDIAKELNMSCYSYSVKKRKALRLLGAVLWGCESDVFVRFLTEER